MDIVLVLLVTLVAIVWAGVGGWRAGRDRLAEQILTGTHRAEWDYSEPGCRNAVVKKHPAEREE